MDSRIVEVGEDGTLQLPRELLGGKEPGDRFLIKEDQGQLVLIPVLWSREQAAAAAARLLAMRADLPDDEEPPMELINEEIHAYRREKAWGELLVMTAALDDGTEPPMDRIDEIVHRHRREKRERAGGGNRR